MNKNVAIALSVLMVLIVGAGAVGYMKTKEDGSQSSGIQSVAQLTKEQVLNGYDECGIQFKNGFQEMTEAAWDQLSKTCDDTFFTSNLSADNIVFADLDNDGIMEALVPAGVTLWTPGNVLYVFKNDNNVARVIDTVSFGKEYGIEVASVSGDTVVVELKNMMMESALSKETYVFKNGQLIKDSGGNSSESGSVYENAFMKVTIPDGWSAKEATHIVYGEGGGTVQQNPAAVNIIRDNYILYINTAAGQASGIIGGRFGEIAGGAPSVDAVFSEGGQGHCGVEEWGGGYTDNDGTNFSLKDLYLNTTNRQAWCFAPTNGKTVWYFSYIGPQSGGYFNEYSDGKPGALVITMSYNTKNIDQLPIQGSASLDNALAVMTKIAQSLQVK